VKVWTAHEKPHTSPILLREGFSVGALIFGPLWLAMRRAWLPAGASLVLAIAILLVTHPPASIILILGEAVLLGFSGRDLARWSIARRGFLETNVVAARNEDEAQTRLLAERPDLVERSMAAEAAR
jgi:Protein of unknown function (DUF2628)